MAVASSSSLARAGDDLSSLHSFFPPQSETQYDLHDPEFLDRIEREGNNTAVHRKHDLLVKYAQLEAMEKKISLALQANASYREENAKGINVLTSAHERLCELELIAHDLVDEISAPQNIEVSHDALQYVNLPWFRFFHQSDLQSHPDAEILYNYYAATKPPTWTKEEITALKKVCKSEAIRAKSDFVKRGVTRANGINWTRHDESIHIDWHAVAATKELSKHTSEDCRLRWINHEHDSLSSAKWSKVEIDKLHALVEEKGERDWAAISSAMGNRTAAACLRQYRNRVTSKKDWSGEEDDRLREAITRFGANWQSVARFVGRTSNQCINRWTKTLKPGIKRGRWTEEEDENLRAAVAACGTVWKKVGVRVRGRTDQQCRERWANSLDPRLKRASGWTADDDTKLRQAVADLGERWADIASTVFAGSRTDNTIFRRWEELTKGEKSRARKKRQAETAKGATLTSINRAAAQSGVRKSSNRRKAKTKSQDIVEPVEDEEEEDQLEGLLNDTARSSVSVEPQETPQTLEEPNAELDIRPAKRRKQSAKTAAALALSNLAENSKIQAEIRDAQETEERDADEVTVAKPTKTRSGRTSRSAGKR